MAQTIESRESRESSSAIHDTCYGNRPISLLFKLLVRMQGCGLDTIHDRWKILEIYFAGRIE